MCLPSSIQLAFNYPRGFVELLCCSHAQVHRWIRKIKDNLLPTYVGIAYGISPTPITLRGLTRSYFNMTCQILCMGSNLFFRNNIFNFVGCTLGLGLMKDPLVNEIGCYQMRLCRKTLEVIYVTKYLYCTKCFE